MKKRTLFIGIVLLIVLSCALLFGCDSGTKRLSVQCPVCGELYKLPFRPTDGTAHGNFITFTTDMSLRDMRDKVDRKSKTPVTTELYENFLVVKFSSGGEHTHFYVVEKTEETRIHEFTYATPVQTFYIEKTYYDIMVPYFLLDIDIEDSETNEIYEIKNDKEYRLACSPEQLADFYREVGIYDIAQTDTAINIAVRPDAYIADGPGMRHSRTSFTIETAIHADGIYVKYTNFKNI